jgi:hypothetical protein
MAFLLYLMSLKPLNCILFGKRRKDNSFAEESATGQSNGLAAFSKQAKKEPWHSLPIQPVGCAPLLPGFKDCTALPKDKLLPAPVRVFLTGFHCLLFISVFLRMISGEMDYL